MSANWKHTRKATTVISLVRAGVTEGGGWSGDTSDPHPPVGNEEGTTRLARVEVRFLEPSSWPSTGHLVSAHLTMHESGTSSHSRYQGSSSRANVRRINAKPDHHSPSSTAGTTKEFTFNGSETHDVAEMVELMLPPHIKRRDGTTAGGNTLYGWFQIRSSDEENDAKSFVMTDDLTLTIEIKTVATPDAPDVTTEGLGPIGAQADSSDPTIVASTDGQTLAVKYRFRGAAGDAPSKVELELWDPLDTDADLEAGTGHRLRTTGAIAPAADEGGGVRTVRLTGIPIGTAGRYTVRTTSVKGGQGDRSSIDDDDSHIKVVVLPGAPLDIVFQPFTDDPHILFSLNSPDSTDYLTGGEVEATLLPQGTVAWASGMQDIGGTSRRADLTWGGVALPDGQRVSFRTRTKNRYGVIGAWSAPQVQTVKEKTGPTVTPNPGRVTSTTPTFTITDAAFDGYRLRLLDAADDSRVLYDTGGQTVVNLTTKAVTIPVGVLTYGMTFRVVASTEPDGTFVYGVESQPQTYTVAALPVSALSVPDSFNRRIGSRDVEWLRTITDPDGAAISAIDMELRVGATPQGSGALIVRREDTVTMPALSETGRQLDGLTSATGWTGDTNVTPGTYTGTAPTGYATSTSLELAFAASVTDRGAWKVLATALDLSEFGGGTLLRIHRRGTSNTNLTSGLLRLGSSATDYWSWEIFAAAFTINTWAEVIARLGTPTATAGTPDLSAIDRIGLWLDATGSYAGSWEVRDLRIGTTQTAKTVPDGYLAWESTVDARIRAINDAADIASTTLSAQGTAGATSLTMTSETGFAVGQTIEIGGAIPELREVVSLGPLTFADALVHTHANSSAVKARPFGQPSAWLTISVLQPPDVVLSSPANAATVTNPFQTLAWTPTLHGSRTQASAVATLYDADGNVLATIDVDDDATSVATPAYLLEDATDYAWDVTVADSGNMSTTSAQRTFTTAFAEPIGIVVLNAEADPDTGSVVVAWDASTEPYLHHYEVVWIADDGSPVRIDGGPETLLDGNEPMTGTTLTHIGARLGDNVYYVAVSNGWRASDPVSDTATLTRPDFRAWCLVDGSGEAVGLIVTSASIPHAGTIERFQPPGGQPRQVTWGSEARRLPISVTLIPSEDGELVSVLRGWMAAGTPVWVKGPAPYLLDPLWATLQDFTPAPEPSGSMSIDLDWLELGDPMHAIIPPVPDPEPVPEPDALLSEDEYDFGSVEVPA